VRVRDQAALVRLRDGLRPALDIELGEEVLQVGFYRVDRNEESVCGLLV
jgi:hypothetical protein